MSDTYDQMLEAARRWADYIETLPQISPEDEELLEAIRNHDEGGA